MPQHNVRDTDTRFTVDPITRAIVNVSQKKTVLIQNDHNSERFTFEIPRYIEAHDMSLCNKVEIHYINIDAVTKMQTEGLYPCDDFGVDPDDDTKVTCSWLISANATQYVGSLAFAVNLQCSDGEKILYRWNTLPNNSVRVSDGINNTEIVVEKYADILQMWWDRLYANANMRIQPVTYDEFVELTNNGQVENGTLYLLTDDPLFGDVGNLQQGMSAVWNAINQNTENIKDSIKKGEVLDIGSGGTGANTAEQAREKLGITLDDMGAASKTHKHDANDIYSGMLDKARLPAIPEDKLPTIPTEKGGTGATTAEQARKNLGAVNKAGDTMTGILQLPHLRVRPWQGLTPGVAFYNSSDVPIGGMNGHQIDTDNRRILVVTYNKDQDEKDERFAEYYQFPTPDKSRTKNGYYNLLTSKNTVTIAQGGTEATTAAQARKNLGAAPKWVRDQYNYHGLTSKSDNGISWNETGMVMVVGIYNPDPTNASGISHANSTHISLLAITDLNIPCYGTVTKDEMISGEIQAYFDSSTKKIRLIVKNGDGTRIPLIQAIYKLHDL